MSASPFTPQIRNPLAHPAQSLVLGVSAWTRVRLKRPNGLGTGSEKPRHCFSHGKPMHKHPAHPLKILHVGTTYKPVGDASGYGGVERHVLHLASLQASQGHTVQIISTEDSTHPLAVPLLPRNHVPISPTFPHNNYDPLSIAMARSCELATDADVVHDHQGSLSLYAMQRQTDMSRWFISVYAQPRHYAYKQMFAALSTAIRHTAVRPFIIMASHDQRRDFAQILAADTVIHPIPRDCPDYSATCGVAPLCLAGIRPDKCQLELALAAKRVRTGIIFAGPLLIYDDTSRSYADSFLQHIDTAVDAEAMSEVDLRSLISNLDCADRTVYLGELVSESKIELLFSSASRLILLNRTREVFSTVVLEALLRGIPVVAGPYDSAWESSSGMAHILATLDDTQFANALHCTLPQRELIRDFVTLIHNPRRWCDQVHLCYLRRLRSQHACM